MTRNRVSCLSLRSGAVAFLLGAVALPAARADVEFQHNGVGRVYDPYVQPLELELEFRTLYQTDPDPLESDILRQRIGFGRSLSERVFAEAYLLAEKQPGGSLRLQGYEAEVKVQLTELLFEFERERSESISEAAVAALTSRQFGNWVGTLNLGVEYEYGSDIANEFETFASAQWRYRLRETLEPGVEFYADQFTRGIGPVLTGLVRSGSGSKWAWETGLILPLNDTTPDYTFRFLLEYEF
jgi:hypothetical protein